jgi:hypothetical protein
MTASAYVATAGASLARAKAAMIAFSMAAAPRRKAMLGLAEMFKQPDVAYLAPRKGPVGAGIPTRSLRASARDSCGSS